MRVIGYSDLKPAIFAALRQNKHVEIFTQGGKRFALALNGSFLVKKGRYIGPYFSENGTIGDVTTTPIVAIDFGDDNGFQPVIPDW